MKYSDLGFFEGVTFWKFIILRPCFFEETNKINYIPIFLFGKDFNFETGSEIENVLRKKKEN